MHIQTVRDTLTKLAQSAAAATLEPAGDQPRQEGPPRYQARSLADCITNVVTPRGAKPVLTTACERNCFYCPFRAGRSKTARVTFSPDELAQGFHTLQQAGRVDGLF